MMAFLMSKLRGDEGVGVERAYVFLGDPGCRGGVDVVIDLSDSVFPDACLPGDNMLPDVKRFVDSCKYEMKPQL